MQKEWKSFFQRMKKNLNGVYYCDGCNNSLTGDGLQEIYKESKIVEGKSSAGND